MKIIDRFITAAAAAVAIVILYLSVEGLDAARDTPPNSKLDDIFGDVAQQLDGGAPDAGTPLDGSTAPLDGAPLDGAAGQLDGGTPDAAHTDGSGPIAADTGPRYPRPAPPTPPPPKPAPRPSVTCAAV